MAKIRELDRHVADLIAAGEVVERPASVVKELVENSVDAGAKNITVEIKRGGLEMIRISDDGSGIDSSDVRTAFVRHATSKISSAEDLESIGTMGFRGEALASIASVSKISLFTRTPGELAGVCYESEGGVETLFQEAGCPLGTTFMVKELFFNTPARMKFIKKDSAEASQIKTVVRRAALAHPDVSFKYISDGAEEYQTPGDSNLKSAIYCVYGPSFTAGLERIKLEHNGISVFGYVSKPIASAGNRTKQDFFVNSRPIKSRTLTAALEEAYRNKLMVNRFPSCVVHIDIAPELLDVNVHPAKSEVKFAFDKQVFDALYLAVQDAINTGDARAELVYTPKGGQDFFKAMRPDEYKVAYTMPEFNATKPQIDPPLHQSNEPLRQDIPLQSSEPEPIAVWKINGEVFNSYIVVEDGDDLLFIDKHAAHERIIYERLKEQQSDPLSQLLLEPVVIKPERDELDVVLKNRELLSTMGFDVEEFGGGSIILRALPEDIDPGDAEASLQEIAQSFLENRRATELQKREEALRLVACKAALKAGSLSTYSEKYALVERVMQFDDIKYCPHGRPVAALLTKGDLERRLGRA